jgi:predicted transcriptional regulator
MTRHLSLVPQFTNTFEASLPTSRHASGQELGIFAILRSLVPRRPLDPLEAGTIAEFQAARLLDLAQLAEPPTPSALISELPRVLVRTDPDLPASGASHWANGRWLLLINSSEPLTRQRFSLAHEYAHALQYRYRDINFVDRPGLSADQQAELAADAFAAALLMPRAWVEHAWRNGTQRLSDLTDVFQVSPRAMARRLETLELRVHSGLGGSTLREVS